MAISSPPARNCASTLYITTESVSLLTLLTTLHRNFDLKSSFFPIRPHVSSLLFGNIDCSITFPLNQWSANLRYSRKILVLLEFYKVFLSCVNKSTGTAQYYQ